jgi:hypothetical protein
VFPSFTEVDISVISTNAPQIPSFGISVASPEKMSMPHNPLIMDEKFAVVFLAGGPQGASSSWNLGQKPHGIACGYSICPFFVHSVHPPLTLNNI